MKIRKACIDDIEQLAILFDAYRVFCQKSFDLTAARSFLTQRLKNEESIVYLAENELNEALGFVQLYPLFSSTQMKRLWLLNDLFVADNYRGKGCSKPLIDAAKQLCKESNAVGLILETELTNVIGNSLYPKVGFKLDVNHNYYS